MKTADTWSLLLSSHQSTLTRHSSIPKVPRPRPASPTGMAHSASLPPSSFREYQTTPTKTKRRHSDRIRSPSDSSSTSSDSEHDVQRTERINRQSSVPPESSPRAFPSSPSVANVGIRALPAMRTKTLSDPSRRDSPLAARMRANGSKPPSSFGVYGETFARPSPASRRRRGSNASSAGSVGDDGRNPTFAPRAFGRSSSSTSISATSPTYGRFGKSPSPEAQLVSSGSFYDRAKSPEEAEEDADQAEAELHDGEVSSGHASGEGSETDEVEDDVLGRGMTFNEDLTPRLSQLSVSCLSPVLVASQLIQIQTESSTSLRTSHDKLRALQKRNEDLARRLKESERQLGILG